MALLSAPDNLTELLVAENDPDVRSWAHVSGWLQMSGTRHTVSCVLLCRNVVDRLGAVLPYLSDALTECGYPWEVLALDVGSVDGTRAVLELWSELRGFHVFPMPRGTDSNDALALGLFQARGDAVVIIDAEMPHSPTLLPRMILQWESGARLVFAVHAESLGASHLVRWEESDLQPLLATSEFNLPSEATVLGLLDRCVVQRLFMVN